MAVTSLMRKLPAHAADSDPDTPRHLGWLMMTALGIGATIGAGIFAMPGMIAMKAGPAGVFSFVITGAVIMAVGICYERFARIVPTGVSAYSYVYHSIGELFAWIVAWGLFIEYSFGASAVAIAWSEYLKRAVNLSLPAFWSGPTHAGGEFQFGVNIIALSATIMVTLILIFGGVSKSAKLNFLLVCLKMGLLLVFLVAGIKHLNLAHWEHFMPKGMTGVLQGAALAVFPYVGFDALYTFARESKSVRDTRLATYLCISRVATLYVAVMAVATLLAPSFFDGDPGRPNPLFVGSEASAPLAMLLGAAGEEWTARLIAIGAVIGIFNVLLVLCMGGPRIFRNMAEDGLLPPVLARTYKGNPTVGLVINGIVVGGMAGFLPFGDIAEMMVLGTLIAFAFVGVGALVMRIVNPLIGAAAAAGCMVLALYLSPLVLKVYAVTLPAGLLIYWFYGRTHSKLAGLQQPTL